MLRTIIIEDELDAQNLLSTILKEYCPDIESVAIASNVRDGIKLIEETEPHLVFLDIQLGVDQGFQILDFFRKPSFKIIFTTAYSDYALKAFEYQALDYLLKPFGPKQVISAVSRAKEQIRKEDVFSKLDQLKQNSFKNEKIGIPTSEGILYLQKDDIVRIQADRAYCKIYLSNGNTEVVSKSLKKVSAALPQELFVRPHTSHLVNLNYVNKLAHKDGGFLLLKDGTQIPVSRVNKAQIMNRLGSTI